MPKTRASRVTALCLGVALGSQLLPQGVARANVGQEYGFGSRNGALGGAGAAWGFDGYAAYLNPAALAFRDGKKIEISYGLVYMAPSFLPIQNVVVENGYTSDKPADQPRFDNVDTDYRSTFGQELGLGIHLLPDMMNFSAGATIFLPVNQVAYLDTGEAFAPEYVLYRSRTQRPQIELGTGIEPIGGVYIGAGLHVAFSLTSNATVFLQSDPNKPSTLRFAATMKPKAAPYFGILVATDGSGPHEPATSDKPEPMGAMTFGAVLRLPVSSDNNMTLASTAGILSPLPAIDFQFAANSAIYYDPLSLELGWSIQHPYGRFMAQVDYQQWGKFVPPALSVQNGTSSTGILISNSKNPTFNYRNTLTPRFGEELSFGAITLRGGYAYHQSIFSSLPAGAGNYLDPPKHIITAGVGYHFASLLGFDTPFNVDASFAYHSLIAQHIVKTPGDETGAGTGDLKIGAPGYDAGGKILGGGVSLTFEF